MNRDMQFPNHFKEDKIIIHQYILDQDNDSKKRAILITINLLVSVEKYNVLLEPTKTASFKFVASSSNKLPTFRSKVEATFSSS